MNELNTVKRSNDEIRIFNEFLEITKDFPGSYRINAFATSKRTAKAMIVDIQIHGKSMDEKIPLLSWCPKSLIKFNVGAWLEVPLFIARQAVEKELLRVSK